MSHERVVLGATRSDGVDFIIQVIAAAQPPQSAHRPDIARIKPVFRDHAQPTSRKHRQQRTVFELADAAW